MIEKILEDALFAAIAAIGFSAISNPPRRAYLFCALIAAVGHSSRYMLMNPSLAGINIIAASAIASFIVGTMAVLLSPRAKVPAETFLFPSLLPMIPGIYAYKAFGGLAMCVIHNSETDYLHYFYLFSTNGLICMFIILGMVIGGTLPTFIFRHVTYRATR
ncbi:threonine/serine exporter family protein [uncultured Muribaculum sp.]|uniref:threonine/serine exporter family protein n=1 Tax=uncultured Muribaculum sp. TaxID=1918613 RepID=UPI0025CE6C7E|nr:threonine/serine exporter family protein [uncultured Muribaculum sp.]